MLKAEKLIEEFQTLFAALFPDREPRTLQLLEDGRIETRIGRRWMSTIDPTWFQIWLLQRNLYPLADATHEWWKPGCVDEVCRGCGKIRRKGGNNGVCANRISIIKSLALTE